MKINLILDSGAFSAWSLGKPIDLKAYISFCQANRSAISHIINLDYIDPNNPENAASIGRQNFLEMKNAGLDVVPVFHARETMHWLELMCQDCSYIGLSGTSLVSPVEVKYFYDLCFHYLSDSSGKMTVDTHSFGDTSPQTLYNYPYTSADSSTWMIQAGRAARVKLQGKSYQLRSTSIRDTSYISNDDTGPKRQSWEEEITSLGLNPERVMNTTTTPSQMAMIRSYLVLSDLLRLQERTKHVTTFKRSASLLMKKRSLTGGREREGPVRLAAVISPSAYYFNFPLVYVLNCKNILVSYFYVEGAPKKFWDERLCAFMENPKSFCETNPKVAKYYDKIMECMIRPPASELNVPEISITSEMQAVNTGDTTLV